MKFSAIRAYQIGLPRKQGRYNWSSGNSVSVFDSTVVAVETDEGLTGWVKSPHCDWLTCPHTRAANAPPSRSSRLDRFQFLRHSGVRRWCTLPS